ncbi:MAG: phosphoribosylformylglycinamidine synthase subunit PurL [Candidatus Kapabacteria bacterium]|nr:phosphoribosylformylglycinamidine synthase subunit PurL [Candidatus Kapabacteria bacterium]
MENNLYSEIEVTLETALECGLTESEYNKILSILGRTPTYTEIGVFGVMWSEHCSYKNSIKLLKTLPRKGSRLLVEAGEENAGLVDIGGGYAICFKIESHNHPSAIEPFQGAATGVGGILRDIFSMGARPIAALNSLRFGELSSDRVKYLVKGVVGGISHYGNSFGVPTVAGEIYFDDCYFDNPLVNAMAVGIVRTDRIAKASAKGKGNPVFIVGSSTGRDGIHGASLLASREFDEKTDDMRPTVQVGDPFAEKLLLEATLELIKNGVVVGVQDMGAAGISCSTSEMSARGNSGMVVDLDKVPLREKGMTPYEIMLSESQERMLFIIDENKVDRAIEICKKWDVPITQIGYVTDTGILEIFHSGNKVCNLPAESLVLGGGAPQYDRETKKPDYIDENDKISDSKLEDRLKQSNINFNDAFWKLLSSPNIASKRWVFEQYDSQVRTNTISIKGDAAVMRLKELSGKGIALSVDCNSRYVYLNPYVGAMIAVAEAARNVACVGAEPIAITNCLNFGNPYDPEVYWTFSEAIRGMGDACRFFNTPVTGGNVSFHNESRNRAIFPTPTIGMLGIIDNLEHICQAGFKNEGDLIFLVGNNRSELGGSEVVKLLLGETIGKCPQLNLEEEGILQKTILTAIKRDLINSAHDCSEGGLAICLAEKSIFSKNKLGAEIKLNYHSFGSLFGESQSRIIVTISPEKENEFNILCRNNNLECYYLGVVSKNSFIIDGVIETTNEELVKVYEEAIPKYFE